MAKMPEKWVYNGVRLNTHKVIHYYMGSETSAKFVAEVANDAMDQAYAAGLEAGRTETKVAQAQPAPESPAVRDMTDVEKVVWGQVYAAVMSHAYGVERTWEEIRKDAREEADAAILAMRECCWKSADFRVMAESEAGVLEVRSNGWNYTRADIVTHRIEAGRDEATKAERERCAGKIRQLIEASKAKRPSEPTTLEHGINVGQQDALKAAFDCILNPTK